MTEREHGNDSKTVHECLDLWIHSHRCGGWADSYRKPCMHAMCNSLGSIASLFVDIPRLQSMPPRLLAAGTLVQ